jgi:hypothetical protein
MYNRNNEFGAIRSNQKANNKFASQQRKRSNSQARLDSDRFSQVSDIQYAEKSNFINPRGSNFGTLDVLFDADNY